MVKIESVGERVPSSIDDDRAFFLINNDPLKKEVTGNNKPKISGKKKINEINLDDLGIFLTDPEISDDEKLAAILVPEKDLDLRAVKAQRCRQRGNRLLDIYGKINSLILMWVPASPFIAVISKEIISQKIGEMVLLSSIPSLLLGVINYLIVQEFGDS